MTNIANPYMLWLKQGLYYVLGGALSYIIYKIGRYPLYSYQNIIYGFYCITYWTCRGSFSLYKTTYISILSHPQSLIMVRLPGITSRALSFQPSEFMKIIMVMYL